jgi:uncharacterized protein YfcZ (UPF0381/DUF406 family)
VQGRYQHHAVFGCVCVQVDDLQHTLAAQCTVSRASVGASRGHAQRDMQGAKQLRKHVSSRRPSSLFGRCTPTLPAVDGVLSVNNIFHKNTSV